jgi:hypothetical protein
VHISLLHALHSLVHVVNVNHLRYNMACVTYGVTNMYVMYAAS